MKNTFQDVSNYDNFSNAKIVLGALWGKSI